MTDIEKKARVYARSAADNDLQRAFLAGAACALAGQWREFNVDNAPPMFIDMLIRGEQGDVMVNQLVYTNLHPLGRQIAWAHPVNCKVTHFMLIPECNPENETNQTNEI